jgi:hypothetical protein
MNPTLDALLDILQHNHLCERGSNIMKKTNINSSRLCEDSPFLGDKGLQAHNGKGRRNSPPILFVATPLWPSVGVKPNTWKSWDLESSGTPECSELDSKGQNT